MVPRRTPVERLLRSLLEEAAAIGEEQAVEVLKALQGRLQANQQLVGEDPFAVLGVALTDPPALVTAVYRTKARFFHPDNKETGDAAAFRRIQAAYTQVQQIQAESSGYDAG